MITLEKLSDYLINAYGTEEEALKQLKNITPFYDAIKYCKLDVGVFKTLEEFKNNLNNYLSSIEDFYMALFDINNKLLKNKNEI